MTFLLALPAFVKIAAVFLAILLIYRFGVSLGASIIACSLVLSLWTGTGIDGVRFLLVYCLRPDNYLLAIVIVLLLYFTEALRITGKMERTVAALRSLFSGNRFLLAGLPALIGLLPMPGGALFSAPFVEGTDSRKELTPHLKIAINYWFRHIWEYWWPLYPGVILAIKYSGLPVGSFFLAQIPFTLAALAGGYFFILRKVRNTSDKVAAQKPDFRATLSTVGPILLLVTVAVLGVPVCAWLGVPESLRSLFSMLAGIALGLTIVFRNNIDLIGKSFSLFKQKGTLSLLLLIVGVLAFSAVLKEPVDLSGSTLVSLMRDEFAHMGVPVIPLIILITFISGAVTGIAMGYVGASFPLVFALSIETKITSHEKG